VLFYILLTCVNITLKIHYADVYINVTALAGCKSHLS